jgi:hypothetical protein
MCVSFFSLFNDTAYNVGRKQVVTLLKYYPFICLRRPTETLSQDSHPSNPKFKLGPPEYKTGVLNVYP